MLQEKGKGQKRKAGFSWWFVIFDDLANIESIAQFSKKCIGRALLFIVIGNATKLPTFTC